MAGLLRLDRMSYIHVVMRHHTKDKGDSGVGFVIADLLSVGIQVALPISEHLPFDLIAISEDNQLRRLSVKYRAMKNGKVDVPFRTSWNDRNGTHVKHVDMSKFDATAVFCPDTGICYYVRNDEIESGASVFVLRIEPARNGQKENVRMAELFSSPSRLFASLAQRTERPASTR